MKKRLEDKNLESLVKDGVLKSYSYEEHKDSYEDAYEVLILTFPNDESIMVRSSSFDGRSFLDMNAV
jgi:hypothetical protein